MSREIGGRRENGPVSDLPPEIPTVAIRNFCIAARSDERDAHAEHVARLIAALAAAEATGATHRTRFEEEHAERRRLHDVVMVCAPRSSFVLFSVLWEIVPVLRGYPSQVGM